MTADVDRAQVYAAELTAFNGTDLEDVVGIDAVRSMIDAVAAGEWWPGGNVEVRATRSDARSSATHGPTERSSGATIAIAPPQATLATGMHDESPRV